MYVNAAVNPILYTTLTTSNCSPSGIRCEIAEYRREDYDGIDPDGIEGGGGGSHGEARIYCAQVNTFKLVGAQSVTSLTETHQMGTEVQVSNRWLTGIGNRNQEKRLLKLMSVSHLHEIFQLREFCKELLNFEIKLPI